jgi:glycosyltransferase involved in cell wall biosynthesis
LFDEHRALLALSRFEGFGLVVLEALSHGVSVVAADVPGPRDILERTGQLVPVGDVAAATEALRRALADEGALSRAEANVIAAQRYVPDRVVDLLCAGYVDALRAKHRSRA